MTQKTYGEIFEQMPQKDTSLLGNVAEVQEALGVAMVHTIPAVSFVAEAVTPHRGAINSADWMAVPQGILPKKSLNAINAVASTRANSDRDLAIKQAVKRYGVPTDGPNRLSEFDVGLMRAAWKTGVNVFRADLKPKLLGEAPDSSQEIRRLAIAYPDYDQAAGVVKEWLEKRSQFADMRDMAIAQALVSTVVQVNKESMSNPGSDRSNDGILTLLPSTMSTLYILRQAGLPTERITPSTVEQIRASHEDVDQPTGEDMLVDEAGEDIKFLHDRGLWAIDDLIPDPITRGQAKLQAGLELTEEDVAQTLFALVAYGNIIGKSYRDFPNNWPASLHNACNYILSKAKPEEVEALFAQTVAVSDDQRVLDFTNLYVDLVNAHGSELDIDMSPDAA